MTPNKYQELAARTINTNLTNYEKQDMRLELTAITHFDELDLSAIPILQIMAGHWEEQSRHGEL